MNLVLCKFLQFFSFTLESYHDKIGLMSEAIFYIGLLKNDTMRSLVTRVENNCACDKLADAVERARIVLW